MKNYYRLFMNGELKGYYKCPAYAESLCESLRERSPENTFEVREPENKEAKK